ncbi:hypothetical protein [Chroogloeocystis siderophila]|jgi:hypothetical protein|uniref:Uncharacterized protein n=1 Tax=Chroogloeocystis siderophila 5.2 s.c.1 TaxID=247279 RepID=A0A1U7HK42_9CHRO|nr:hypothetical protein [Chroogloeocystis siderophila]OKH23921.1 hypothetical protein NIES1031_16625 [Chroogloeocystis siderophila 5.2 s.c.1]
MNRLAALELYPYNSLLWVYDAVIDPDYLNYAAEHILTQGFSGHPRSYKFFTLGECMNLKLEIWKADTDSQSAIVLRDDTIRAVKVPFSISDPKEGVMFDDNFGLMKLRSRLDSNTEFALVFEIKLRNDSEYLNSSQYHEDVDGAFTQECCYLTFYPTEKPVQPEVLRIDAWTSPPYEFSRYTPLAPTYPLILDAEPTQSLPW